MEKAETVRMEAMAAERRPLASSPPSLPGWSETWPRATCIWIALAAAWMGKVARVTNAMRQEAENAIMRPTKRVKKAWGRAQGREVKG
jgi:hypothetical protein